MRLPSLGGSSTPRRKERVSRCKFVQGKVEKNRKKGEKGKHIWKECTAKKYRNKTTYEAQRLGLLDGLLHFSWGGEGAWNLTIPSPNTSTSWFCCSFQSWNLKHLPQVLLTSWFSSSTCSFESWNLMKAETSSLDLPLKKSPHSESK